MIAQRDGAPGGEQRPGEPLPSTVGRRRRRIRDELLWLGSVAAPGILVLLLYLILR